MTVSTHLILIHGAWAGPWVWEAVTEPLNAKGIRTHAVTLPGVGSWVPDEEIGLDDLVAAVLDRIDGLDGTLVLVGHSGGGIVATQVAERIPERIAGIVYVAGMMLPAGMSYGDLCADIGIGAAVGVGPYLRGTADGRGSVVPPEAAASIFFHLADPKVAIAAANRLVPQMDTARLIAPTWTPERSGDLPRLYIEALQDRSLPLAVQRRMQELSRGAEVAALDADHAPQLSRPDQLATVLASFATALDTTADRTGTRK
ncbi:MAG: alpha/beta fold hydrolase [Rhodococcus sp.]|nr:alpha/beta fold hydrolase [Rhodococcus sp. (in: high G+C Gram-positive bacteria)]